MKVSLEVIEGPNEGRKFAFDRRDRFLVGRTPKAHLCVSRDRFFSRHHFMVEVNPPNVLIVDLRSTNGTYVNSKSRRVEETMLEDGDVILGGKTKLRVSIDDGHAASSIGAATRERVRCRTCGREADRERARASDDAVSYLCPGCQDALRDAPVLPEGYRFVSELGRGAMGCVYLAHASDGAERAVKIVMPNAALTQRARAEFVERARAQSVLDHPRIVRIHDVSELTTGVFCVVMDYVAGPSLSTLLARVGRLERSHATRIAGQMLEALDYAHGRSVVHRDIKPANVLVGSDADGQPSIKLADFGLARTYAETGASGFASLHDVDEALRYKAPEQIINFRDVQPSADLYAVGAVTYRMLSGELPHDLDGERDPWLALLEDDIVPLGRRDASIDPRLASVVERALAREPEQRWESASAMRGALLDTTR